MEEEFRRIYDCMRASDTVADGEYFVIHADHLHDFKRAIEHYFDENKKIEKLKGKCFVDYSLTYNQHLEYTTHNYRVLKDKVNEIIDKLNRMER